MWQREGASRDSVYIPLWAEARFAGPAHPRAPVLSSWIGCSDLPQQSRSALTVDGRSRAALRVSSLTQVRSAQDSTVIYSFKSLVFSCCARARVFVKEGGGGSFSGAETVRPEFGFYKREKKEKKKKKKAPPEVVRAAGSSSRSTAATRGTPPGGASRSTAATRRGTPPGGASSRLRTSCTLVLGSARGLGREPRLVPFLFLR